MFCKRLAVSTLGLIATLTMASGQAPVDLRLDDFEDGSDSGWRVVGHGAPLPEYRKRLLSPGHESVYALCLSKGGATGWCGLGAPDPTRLGLRQCAGVRLAARSVRGVGGLIVDVHLTDGSRWWWKAPHLEFAFERFGLPFRAVSSQFLDLTGVRILVDDGSNTVLTPGARERIAEWVRDGGILVAFPQTGSVDLAGGAQTLASALGVTLAAPSWEAVGPVAVGKGRVVVLPAVPTSDADTARLEALLEGLGAERPITVTSRVNTACFEKSGRTYCVLYNKSRAYVGSFFRESTLAAVESALPDLTLRVRPARPCRDVRNVLTGERYPVVGGEVTVPLPKTTWLALELVPE